ncbi:hypothetical protein ALC60_12715, partial [Trachymyrmex zeteki]
YLCTLHKHLVEAHPDKLTEGEKNKVKFNWTWDYYIAKSNREATCRLCKVTVRYTYVSDLKYHLKTNHEISGPTSDKVIGNENNSDDGMDANKDVEADQKLFSQGNTIQFDSNTSREHYTKLTCNKAICNHCNGEFNINVRRIDTFHKHLVEAHADKLTEKEKNEVKFHWTWDYFILKDCTKAICTICNVTTGGKHVSSLKSHLRRNHKISGPTSDNVIDNENNSDDGMDANKDVEGAEGTEAINEGTPCNLIPIRRWMREHYTKLTRKKARCNHCNVKLSIRLGYLHILHKHLVDAHPEKLTEQEKNEEKFYWIWDYYIVKSNTEATCILCKLIIRYTITNKLKMHLKKNHE